ncbi:MAG: alkaline phosphatase [Verrucomicrobiota bacterium]
MNSRIISNRLLLLVCALCSLQVAHLQGAMAGVGHVVVVGCDGMSPDGVLKANTPTLRQLMKSGAFSMRARAVMPTVSSPNWASMIMGAGPEQHGVTSNDWQTNKFEIAPTVVGPGGMFPTIFSLIRQQRPRAHQAVFHDWGDFGRLFERSMVNFIEDSDGPTNAVRHAIEHLQTHQPLFTFIHLDHVDHAGHDKGHGTPEYYASVEVADQLIGEVIEGLRKAGMWRRTILLITSDHGGKGKGHGGISMAEVEIPWIIHGPGVAAGRELSTPINTYDTAATIAWVLGLRTPECWIARPVLSAFRTTR